MGATDLAGVIWRKSSYSNAQGECVQIAILPGAIAIRDSRNPTAATLTVKPTTWAKFMESIKSDEIR